MSPPNIKKKGANKPIDARRLLDTLTEVKHIATALEEFTNNYGDKLPKSAVNNLNLLSKSANHIHQQGRREVAKVSPVGNLLQSYDKCVKSDRQKEPPRPAHIKLSDSMWRVTNMLRNANLPPPPNRPSHHRHQ